VRTGIITNKDVERAMRKVDRKMFVLDEYKDYAYADTPLPIYANQTISAPHMVAMMSQYLDVRPGMKILEIGSGSGYQAAILAELVGRDGKIFTVERHAKLVEMSRKNLMKWRNIKVILGNGAKGLPDEAPFDRIMVTCAARTIPEDLVKQLKNNGKMVVPVGPFYLQKLLLIEKKNNNINVTDLHCDCVFVPLINEG